MKKIETSYNVCYLGNMRNNIYLYLVIFLLISVKLFSQTQYGFAIDVQDASQIKIQFHGNNVIQTDTIESYIYNYFTFKNKSSSIDINDSLQVQRIIRSIYRSNGYIFVKIEYKKDIFDNNMEFIITEGELEDIKIHDKDSNSNDQIKRLFNDQLNKPVNIIDIKSIIQSLFSSKHNIQYVWGSGYNEDDKILDVFINDVTKIDEDDNKLSAIDVQYNNSVIDPGSRNQESYQLSFNKAISHENQSLEFTYKVNMSTSVNKVVTDNLTTVSGVSYKVKTIFSDIDVYNYINTAGGLNSSQGSSINQINSYVVFHRNLYSSSDSNIDFSFTPTYYQLLNTSGVAVSNITLNKLELNSSYNISDDYSISSIVKYISGKNRYVNSDLDFDITRFTFENDFDISENLHYSNINLMSYSTQKLLTSRTTLVSTVNYNKYDIYFLQHNGHSINKNQLTYDFYHAKRKLFIDDVSLQISSEIGKAVNKDYKVNFANRDWYTSYQVGFVTSGDVIFSISYKQVYITTTSLKNKIIDYSFTKNL